MQKYKGVQSTARPATEENSRPSARRSGGYMLAHIVSVISVSLVIYALSAIFFGLVLLAAGGQSDNLDGDGMSTETRQYGLATIGLYASVPVALFVAYKGWFFGVELRRRARRKARGLSD